MGRARILVIDDETELREAIAQALTLDGYDVAPAGRYQLEVSSPGVERVLRTPAQYRRFVGSVLSVKTAVAIDGARRFRGVLLAVDDDGITLGPDPDADAREPSGVTGESRMAYSDIDKARTVLVWGPTPKPGSAGRGRRDAASRARAATSSAPMKDPAP